MLSTSQWQSSAEYSASHEERLNHASSTTLEESELAVDELWSDYEVLPTIDETRPPLRSAVASLIRGVVQLAAFFLGLRSILAAWQAAAGVSDAQSKPGFKKDD